MKTESWNFKELARERSPAPFLRVTKDSEDLGSLQFPNERREVVCATKYFAAPDVDYWVVTDQTVRWWEPWTVKAEQNEIRFDAD